MALFRAFFAIFGGFVILFTYGFHETIRFYLYI